MVITQIMMNMLLYKFMNVTVILWESYLPTFVQYLQVNITEALKNLLCPAFRWWGHKVLSLLCICPSNFFKDDSACVCWIGLVWSFIRVSCTIYPLFRSVICLCLFVRTVASVSHCHIFSVFYTMLQQEQMDRILPA